MSYPSEKQKEPVYSSTADTDLGAPPPSYDEAVPSAAQDNLPEYGNLSDNLNAEAGPSSCTTLTAATHKFPPTINCYFQWAFTRTFILGPSNEERLFAASPHAGWRTKRREIILHDGPTDKHPMLATIGKWWAAKAQTPATIVIPPREERGETSGFETEITGVPWGLDQSSARVFSMTVGGKETGTEARTERFQWRGSRGGEVSELAHGGTYGWKLVRLNEVAEGAGGSRREREAGYTSDGHEIVAILATNYKSLTKGLKFSFAGSGLTGILGERWEIVTVATALWTWYTHIEGTEGS
ncbi:hypothetical protein COL5a_001941 [Colletotrichum fioriniae]|uniref:uncharacterized protein n=1 Tax=Colletotrichum fioriniae TaxID=710243 RepID=UPI0023012519|nr:uncharacterized protein COL516b_001332 [Colletotrichum fioriniae]KAJ0312258.1 hypothetical protein COL516b_001332 [Colletotrichum fioriniae]KAJ0332235.1 hypothetical protein COL5a_001941 [Colletotrichum fioriniae]KAJ3945979.1 hypothetical protein N0V96_004329 [Colletotrichum fioriniae]